MCWVVEYINMAVTCSTLSQLRLLSFTNTPHLTQPFFNPNFFIYHLSEYMLSCHWVGPSNNNFTMYHPSQQPPEPTQLACLPLAKFSHTTTSIGHNGPLNWSHIMGNGDIVGRIESHAAPGLTPARVLLKVFRDYELLVSYLSDSGSCTWDDTNAETSPNVGRSRSYIPLTRSHEVCLVQTEWSDEAGFRCDCEAALSCCEISKGRYMCAFLLSISKYSTFQL